MKDQNIVQMKLVNGEEIIAVYENLGVESDEISLSHVLSMVPVEYLDEQEDEKTYYILRPFMSYTDDLATPVGVNPNSVIALSTPSKKVVEQYLTSVDTIQEMLGNGEDVTDTTAGNVVSFPSSKKLLTED